MKSTAYPRHITRPDGATLIVYDHKQHSAHMGTPFGPDGKPVDPNAPKFPEPPTLEEVMAAGYPESVAIKIVELEQAKADYGIVPYGDSPRPGDFGGRVASAPPAPEPNPSQNVTYPCGCSASGSGPEPLPNYCPEHGVVPDPEPEELPQPLPDEDLDPLGLRGE